MRIKVLTAAALGLICVALVALVLSLWYGYVTSDDEHTHNTVIKELPSPDGKYVAYVFVRDFGATTRETYQLSILRSYEGFKDKGGNVLVSDRNFDIKWISNTELAVAEPPAIFVHFKRLDKIKGVTIIYM